MTATNERIVRAVCPHDCPDTCSMLVHLDGDRAVRVSGDPDHRFTQGFLCTKVSRYVERTYHAERLQYPLVRDADGSLRRASWDSAIALVASRLREIARSAEGPQAILPYSYAGTQGLIQGSSIDRRFFHLLGASVLDRTICATAGMEALNVTYGSRMGTDSETVDQSRLIWLWGTNTLTSNPHLWPFIRKARERGARIVCIDPLRTRTADQCDEHIAIRPGTDALLAMAMAGVLFREGLVDSEYLSQMTVGSEAYRERVLTDEYLPERADSACRLPAGTTRRLAIEYGSTSPSFIRLNYGLQRHAGGGNAVRAISILPALTGQWRFAGGGSQLSVSSTFGLRTEYLEREDLIPDGTRVVNMNRLGDALTTLDDPPVRALIVYNSNPGAVAPDLRKVREGLRRDDLFVVVLEHFLTDTCDYADVVLPATTQLEHWDIHKSYGHLWVMLNKPSIPAVGEALPNTEIFRRIARAMGIEDPLIEERDESLIRGALDSASPAMQGITFESLLESPQRLNVGSPHLPYAPGTTLPTASGRIEISSSALATRGGDPLPSWIPPRESVESNPELAARYPLVLISPPAHQFLNSTFVNVVSLRRTAGEPTIEIHPDDAAARSITNGSWVEAYNDRGSFPAAAVVTDRVRPGVVSAPSVWWPKLTGGSNANDTTSQALADLGGGATFYDNLVDVRVAVPPVTG